jgi:hypothetical protein
MAPFPFLDKPQAERVFDGLGIKLRRASIRRGFGDDEDDGAGLFVVE